MELSYFAIIIGAIFVNNVVLAQFLGICPFLGVSSKVDTSLGMGAAVTFVMALASIVYDVLDDYIIHASINPYLASERQAALTHLHTVESLEEQKLDGFCFAQKFYPHIHR